MYPMFSFFLLRPQASTFNNVLTSGLQSLWMMHHLLGHVQLPNPATMLKVRGQGTRAGAWLVS